MKHPAVTCQIPDPGEAENRCICRKQQLLPGLWLLEERGKDRVLLAVDGEHLSVGVRASRKVLGM